MKNIPAPSARFVHNGDGLFRRETLAGKAWPHPVSNTAGAYDSAQGLRGSRQQPAKRPLSPKTIGSVYGLAFSSLSPSNRDKLLGLLTSTRVAMDADLDSGLTDDADGPEKLPADLIARILNAIGPHLASEDLSEFQRMLAAASAEEPVLGRQKAAVPSKPAVLPGAQDAAGRASFAALHPDAARIHVDHGGEAVPTARKRPAVAMDTKAMTDFDTMYPGVSKIGAA